MADAERLPNYVYRVVDGRLWQERIQLQRRLFELAPGGVGDLERTRRLEHLRAGVAQTQEQGLVAVPTTRLYVRRLEPLRLLAREVHLHRDDAQMLDVDLHAAARTLLDLQVLRHDSTNVLPRPGRGWDGQRESDCLALPRVEREMLRVDRDPCAHIRTWVRLGTVDDAARLASGGVHGVERNVSAGRAGVGDARLALGGGFRLEVVFEIGGSGGCRVGGDQGAEAELRAPAVRSRHMCRECGAEQQGEDEGRREEGQVVAPERPRLTSGTHRTDGGHLTPPALDSCSGISDERSRQGAGRGRPRGTGPEYAGPLGLTTDRQGFLGTADDGEGEGA